MRGIFLLTVFLIRDIIVRTGSIQILISIAEGCCWFIVWNAG